MRIEKIKTYAMLYTGYLIFSLNLVSARFAAEYPLFSFTAVFLYGLAFFCLALFALIYQQVLKRMPLSTAYANRAITMVFGMMWASLLFSETITWNMVFGGIIIMIGVVLMVMRRE